MIARACDGWKVLGANGRTVARFKGFRAHARAARFDERT